MAAEPKLDKTKGEGNQPPPAPWGSFPLGQLSILVGLILLMLGFITGNRTQVAVGLVLGSLGGLEFAVREHFAGYRSHTTLLAGVVFVITTAFLFFVVKLVLWLGLLLGIIAASGAFWLFLRKFRNVSGGLSYRIR